MLSTRLGISVAAGLLVLMSGCFNRADESPVVARVYDYELRQSDLEGLMGEGVTAADSATIVANYIDQWIRQTVMLAKAEKNVNTDFSREMNEYRRTLVIYAYEQQMVKQLLDTVVSNAEIEDYYEQHQDEFQLKNSIVKAVYVKTPKKAAAVPKIKSLLAKRDFDDGDVVALEELATKHGFEGYYDANTWMPFYELQAQVPIITYNENLYLKQNRSITIGDDSMSYFVRIVEYKVSDDVSPIELQRGNIKAIIQNHRKIELLGKLQADLMREAEQGGYVERNI